MKIRAKSNVSIPYPRNKNLIQKTPTSIAGFPRGLRDKVFHMHVTHSQDGTLVFLSSIKCKNALLQRHKV